MTTRYLNADTGVDSGAGGIGAPWATLSYAITHCTTGDILYLENATAKYPIGYADLYSVPALLDLTILGQSTAGAEVDLPTSQTVLMQGAGATPFNIKFDTVKFIKDNGYQYYGCLQPVANVNLTLDHCLFVGDVTLTYTFWLGMARNYADQTTTITVKNSVFYDDATSWNAIIAGGASTEYPIYTFYNNVFYNINNFASYNAHYYMATLKNNIFYGMGTFDPGGYWGSNGCVADHNCWYSVGAGTPAGVGDINADPKFTDIGVYNFTLDKAISPCVNAGVIF